MLFASQQPFQKKTGIEPLKGLDALAHSWRGRYNRRDSIVKEIETQSETILGLASEYEELSDGQLRGRLLDYRQEFRRRSKQPPINEALAALRIASNRKLGLEPFKEQIMGALGLLRGNLVEMSTGEGKTLTAGLAAVLAGWTRRPCHVITANDYLVDRDVEWLRSFYDFASVTVGALTSSAQQDARRSAHDRDITYCTSKELLGDYLRDRLQQRGSSTRINTLIGDLNSRSNRKQQKPVLRGLHTAIIDEADSLLIDEAVTPLLISRSRPNDSLKAACIAAKKLADKLNPELHYTLRPKYQEVEFTDEGMRTIDEECQSWTGFWKGAERRTEILKQAVKAREFYRQGEQFLIEKGKIVIVDEFTGRPMPNRSWKQGTHQAVEAKEGLELSDPTETAARQSFQSFFRQFRQLCGMTGTASEAKEEFWQVYSLPVIRVPEHKPCVRQSWPNLMFTTQDSKWKAFIQEVREVHETGRPILIGSRNVIISERIATMLNADGLACRVLNATRLQEEALIISQAGEKRRITVATNMAGRGTDIKLDKGVAELGGLHVMATEFHESARIDRQLFGRCARQGDPGSCRAFGSLEDELIQRYCPVWLLASLKKTNGIGLRPAFSTAQKRAESKASRQRRAVLSNDIWMAKSLSFAVGSQSD